MRQGQKMGGADNKGVAMAVSSASVSNEYHQVLNPNQLYPTHTTQGVSRLKQSSNYNKPPVYKQEIDCRYGVSSSFIYTTFHDS